MDDLPPDPPVDGDPPEAEAEPVEALPAPPEPEPEFAEQASEEVPEVRVAPVPQITKEKRMPRIVCGTCKGKCVVMNGGRMWTCPSCRGSGGRPLGQETQEAVVPAHERPGHSRAARHLSVGVPLSVPVSRRR